MMFQRFSFGNQLNFKSKEEETLKPNANANLISLKRSHTIIKFKNQKKGEE